MSSLTFEMRHMKGADLNGESSLPPIAGMINVQQQRKTNLDEDDGLFIGFGFVDSPFPYRLQDMYDRELKDTKLLTEVLENKHLKAVFAPTLGGRLWSLYDKDKNRELTFSNPVFRPANLAFRNAWFSGGVEWNCGVVGHHPFTCSPLFTAVLTAEDNTKVLRMYEFERIRRCVYQMDFFLPEDSKLLFCRMRIVNPNAETVPMYWWSNIAVPEIKDGRVIVPADAAYTSKGGAIGKTPVPVVEGIDVTYPVNNPYAIDYFWRIEDNNRKYICQLDKEGYGLIQASTSRLQGRKLFVWGQGPGGQKWQRFLTDDRYSGKYAEIQAGLARTQYECIPMPPKTAWEWLEAYGAMNAEGDKVHGDWKTARREVEEKLDRLITAEEMEALLRKTKAIALKPAEQIMVKGSGWGALENMRREADGEDPLPTHLDFGELDTPQQPWTYLLKNGYMKEESPDREPRSWMFQKEWTKRLEKAVENADRYNATAWLHLGVIRIAERKLKEAQACLDRSMMLAPSCWALYGLAHIARLEGNSEKAALLAEKAAGMKPDDKSLVKEALKLLLVNGYNQKVLDLCERLPEEVLRLGRVKLYKAFASVRTGHIEQAEALLYEEGSITVPDIREGENSITDLWYEIEEAKAKRDNKAFDRENATPPPELDFRMHVAKRKQ
jgi:tetratricopeptide (TPR) repeat protein